MYNTEHIFQITTSTLVHIDFSKYQPGGIIRNQIDYMFIPTRFRTSCLRVKTYPGTDIEPDHCSIVRKFRVRLKICKINNEPKEKVRKAIKENL
jgi:hypothetical protein